MAYSIKTVIAIRYFREASIFFPAAVLGQLIMDSITRLCLSYFIDIK